MLFRSRETLSQKQTKKGGDNQDSGGRRKYYNITEDGKLNLDLKIQEWNFIQEVMNKFLNKGK